MLTLLVVIDGPASILALINLLVCFVAMAIHMRCGVTAAVTGPSPSQALLTVRSRAVFRLYSYGNLCLSVTQAFRLMNVFQLAFLVVQYAFEFDFISDALHDIWPAASFLSLEDIGIAS